MSDLSRPGSSSSPPARPGRIAIPPRTLPSHFDDSSPFLFDGRQLPFSPTSPGKSSPSRPKTMKEYEEDLVNLKRENFNLKVKIYFMEQSRLDQNLPKDIDELRSSFTDLKVEFQLQKKDLTNKEDLLLKTYKVLDAQKQQLETLNAEHEAEKIELQNKVEMLEKELKEYHLKFMETSVHLDDTNAMYALTFGLNNKPELVKSDTQLEEKINALQNELIKEKERVLMLEDKIAGLNKKNAKDQKSLKLLHDQVTELENQLKDKKLYQEGIKEAAYQKIRDDRILKEQVEAMQLKEREIEKLKLMTMDLEKEVASMKSINQDKEKHYVQADIAHVKLQDYADSLVNENHKLKQKIKLLQRLPSEGRSTSKPSRDRSGGRKSSELEKETTRLLRDSQLKIEELIKENEELREKTKTLSYSSDVRSVIQSLLKENKFLKKELDTLKAASCRHSNSSVENSQGEGDKVIDQLRIEMSSDRDNMLCELGCKIEELSQIIKEKECEIQRYKTKLESLTYNFGSQQVQVELNINDFEEKLSNQVKENELISKELEEKRNEVHILKRELEKRTFNLQGLVNTELWDKNREIEKLNKVCERQHLEVITLQKKLRDYEVQNKVATFGSITLQSGLFTEDKENMHPVVDPIVQLRHLSEEKRCLVRKVEELQERLLNTPERDLESTLVSTLRGERDRAAQAVALLTTRLQELADFLDSLLPSLCGRKRKAVQQAVERSRELSKSLSLAAEDSTLHCSAWTDLQPSLHVPLLPDISTVDFWSGDEEETFSGVEEVARLKSQVETLTQEVKQKDGEIARFQSEKSFNNCVFLKSVFGLEQHLADKTGDNKLFDEFSQSGNITDVTEGILIETFSDQNTDKTQSSKLTPEVKSANIGTITLTSKKKQPNTAKASVINQDENKANGKDGLSEYDTWSEPDRDVSYARMGLKESPINVNKSLPFSLDDTSETAESAPKSPSSRRGSEIQRLQRKIHSLEQVNEALRNELTILHQLAPPASNRQDKATSIEVSRQSQFCVPSHILEEIRNQREKLEASLFHNDYIRRQLESTVSSLRRSQGDGQEKVPLTKLKEVTNQLELTVNELSNMKLEKEQWNKKMEVMQTSLQQNANELIEKQCALLDLENKTTQRLKEVEEKYNEKCSQIEKKCDELEQKSFDLQKEKEQILERVEESKQQIIKLSSEIEVFEREGKKNKQLQDEINLQLRQTLCQKDELKLLVAEQEQLLADAERERQELATQLIARDRQLSELQQRLSQVERTSAELEAALRSQLDNATHQCVQFEAKIRDLDNANQRREEATVMELRRRLDAARFAHSEAVLQYTRIANDNIRLQQQLRARQPNQITQTERMKNELERRVAELEAVNSELEERLASLNIVKPSYTDCPPPPSPSRPVYSAQRSNDLTSDYLSDQELALSSPQMQSRNLWSPTSPHSQASASPDLGIESDHGRFSSLECHVPRSTAVSLRGTPVKDLIKLEEENSQLRHNLQKTRHALEETLAQLTAANQHKRQYEAQLSAASQHKAKVDRAICRQLHKTHSILKKARVNLEDEGSAPSDHH